MEGTIYTEETPKAIDIVLSREQPRFNQPLERHLKSRAPRIIPLGLSQQTLGGFDETLFASPVRGRAEDCAQELDRLRLGHAYPRAGLLRNAKP